MCNACYEIDFDIEDDEEYYEDLPDPEDIDVLTFDWRLSGPLSPDAPIVVNDKGGKQSDVAFRFDLLPRDALFEVARILKDGAEKYGIDNWRLIESTDHLNHALIHIFAHLNGDTQDEHLQHAATRLLMALDMKIEEDK